VLAPRERDDDGDGRDRTKEPGETVEAWKAIERGRTTIAPEEWDAEAARLAALLRNSDGRRRLVLTQGLEREEESR
jgi:hypothetical protein